MTRSGLGKLVLGIAAVASIATSAPRPKPIGATAGLPVSKLDAVQTVSVYAIDADLIGPAAVAEGTITFNIDLRDRSALPKARTRVDLLVTNLSDPAMEPQFSYIEIIDGVGTGLTNAPAFLECDSQPCSNSWELRFQNADPTAILDISGSVQIGLGLDSDPADAEIVIDTRWVGPVP